MKRGGQYGKEQWEEKLTAVEVSKESMNRAIMDFFETEGYVDAAKEFAKESGTKMQIRDESVSKRSAIRVALQQGKIDQAISLVNDLDSEILDTNPELFLELQIAKLIEMIRDGEVETALTFAQEELAPAGVKSPKSLKEIENALALLAFPDARKSPLASLLQQSNRQRIASNLNRAILIADCKEPNSRLVKLFKLLKWSQEQLQKEEVSFPVVEDLSSGQQTTPSLNL